MDLCNINNIKTLLGTYGFHFFFFLGQNFLINRSIPERIAESAGLDESRGVLEIGPGIGTLTQELSKRAGKVIAVELDKRLIPVLGNTLSGFKNAEIISGDILKTDIRLLVADKLSGFKPCVCANLPYNITSPVIIALIESGCFDTITIMIQREVAARLCAQPGTPEYGALTVFVNYYTEPEILFDVSPDCFMPQPKVTSSVIRLKRRSGSTYSPEDEDLFFKTVKAVFSVRRKTLINALSPAFKTCLSKEDISEIICSCGFDCSVRGETFGIVEFVSLSDAISRAINTKTNRK